MYNIFEIFSVFVVVLGCQESERKEQNLQAFIWGKITFLKKKFKFHHFIHTHILRDFIAIKFFFKKFY